MYSDGNTVKLQGKNEKGWILKELRRDSMWFELRSGVISTPPPPTFRPADGVLWPMPQYETENFRVS
jgi:hypothetical protein